MFFNLFSSHSIHVSVRNNRDENKAAYGGIYLYSQHSRDCNKRIAESLQPALSTQQDPLQNPKTENKITIGCSSQWFQFGDIGLVLLSDQESSEAVWRGVWATMSPPLPHPCLNIVVYVHSHPGLYSKTLSQNQED